MACNFASAARKITAASATFYAMVEYPQYAPIFAFIWGYIVATQESLSTTGER